MLPKIRTMTPWNKTLRALMFGPLFLLPAASTADQGFDKAACAFNGRPLHGDIEVVTSFPDIRVQIVDSFPDLKVEEVTSFPDDCGQWRFVESFPDIKIQYVDSFPDLKIQIVSSFPGVP